VPQLLLLEIRVSKTFCLGWPWTAILLIATSWIARITDRGEPQCPAFYPFFKLGYLSFHCWIMKVLCICWILYPYDMYDLQTCISVP
jgi:hypothetical protein